VRQQTLTMATCRGRQVIDVSTSKTGKHGHAKCHFVATDIFTNKKMEELVPASHNNDVPHVNRQDYTLLDIQDDGFVRSLTAPSLPFPTSTALVKHGTFT
jgi:translation elongation factor IF5A